MRSRPADLLLPALIIVNVALKLLWLGRNELSHDEPFTVVMAHRSWTDLFGLLRGENNPPLHFVLMKIWASVAPLDAGWLRVPSAIFSALTVWPLFLLTRALAGQRAALIAALLFTFNNHLFGLAHEVRAYSLFALLAVTTTWQLWRMAQGLPRAGLWYVLTGIALVYTHFFGWFVVGLHLLFICVLKDLRPARAKFLKSCGLLLLAYLPYLGIFIGRLGSSVEHGTWLVEPLPEELYNMVWRWTNAPVLAVAALLTIIIAVGRLKSRGTALQLGLLWTFVPLFGMFLASYVVPIFLDRYLVYAAPGFHLLLAVALVQAFRGRWALLPVVTVVLGTAITFTPWKENGLHPSQVVRQAEEWRGTGPVLLQPTWYVDTYAWHADRDLVRDPAGLYRGLGMGFVYPVDHAESLPITLGEADSLVLVDAWGALTDPNATVKGALRQRYPRVDSTEADRKVWVYRFAR